MPDAAPPAILDLIHQRARQTPDRDAFTYLARGEVEERTVTYGVLLDRARAVAAELTKIAAPGDRALLLYPSGIDFIEAFVACLISGVVAVPVAPPMPGRDEETADRVGRILDSADPRVFLTAAAHPYEGMLALLPARWRSHPTLHTDLVPTATGARWQPPAEVTGESIAFLQYTSGSTGDPRGVMVSHANLAANVDMIRVAFDLSEADVSCHWLPLYHDMGLIGETITPLCLGIRVYLMSPLDFVQRPLRWLAAIERYRVTWNGSPNFGYDHCVNRVKEDARAGLDLSSWRKAGNGAEPVSLRTLRRFADAFGPAGFEISSFAPCYGLAESTLMVSTCAPGTGPVVVPTRAADGQPIDLVASGTIAAPGTVRIVDPDTFDVCEPGSTGEIWAAGPHVTQGYFRDRDATEHSFGARLPGDDRAYLRTGDLGFLHGEHLVVTGRIKDLIIQRGQNIYPHDLERTAEDHAGLRAGGTVAFAVPEDDEDRVVLLVEFDPVRYAAQHGLDGAEEALDLMVTRVREGIASAHSVAVQEVVAVAAGTIPKTSSGKVRRSTARAGYLASR